MEKHWIEPTDIGTLNGGLWGSETQSNVLVPSSSTLSNSGRLSLRFGVLEDVRLLLESALRLDSKFGGHVCDGYVSQKSMVVVAVVGRKWLKSRR